MDMKKILQVMDGASTKPVEGSNDMQKFLSVVSEGKNPQTNRQTVAEQMIVQEYTKQSQVKKGNGLIKQYFESVQTESAQALAERRAKIKEQARRIAQRMREDAKVSAVDQAKKTITYTDDQTGISTTVPQAMAKPGEGGQVMVDKNQVNQASGQEQQPQPVKVGDMVKMMDTESSSAGVRMQRALQREKEKREYSQRYAEKHFPIGKKPDPIKEPQKDQSAAESSRRLSIGQQMAQDGITYSPEKENELIGLMAQYMKKNGMSSREIRYRLNYDDDYIPDQLSDLPKQDVAEGNEDLSWMNNLRLRK